MKLKFWEKKEKPKKRAYAGAQFNRLVSDWITSTTSADTEARGSLVALRNRARQLERDNDYIRGFLRSIENNIIGQGIPFQAQTKMQRGNKLDDKLNSMIEEKWQRWTRKEFCHTGGTMAFEDIERLAIRSVARDGEFYLRIISRGFGGSKLPFALELIESDLLDEAKMGKTEEGNEIRMGVEVDSWNRPVAYWFLSRHPGDIFGSQVSDGKRKWNRVPASEIIPLFMPERAGQTRGISWLASSMIKLHHLHGYTEAEVIAARAGASLMGFIESPDGEVFGDDVDNGQRVTEFEPGVFKQLNPGEKVNVPDLSRPGGQYAPFVSAMLQSVSSGLGISYESLSKNYSGASYSSARQAMLEDRDYWKAIQKWMIRNFHQVVFERWLDMAVMSGQVSLPGYELTPERFQNVKWMPRGWSWIDPMKEVSAFKEAIKGGILTQSSVLAQVGEDFEDTMTQRAREVQFAEGLGLVFDTDAAKDMQPAPNQPGPKNNDTQNEV